MVRELGRCRGRPGPGPFRVALHFTFPIRPPPELVVGDLVQRARGHEPSFPVVVQRRTITEFIGWDQGRGEIRSWMFCSDGRTAEFRWLRSGTGWLLTHANDPAAATAEPAQLMLERVGADELTLQLQSGIVDDLLPAADFVRTARPIDGDAND